MSNKIKKFNDVLHLIDEKRSEMARSNKFFTTIKDTSLSMFRRMSFVPYMLFFSCGCPDVMTLVMRVNKPDSNLSRMEKKINDFVSEDNFHYNFFLNDLEELGFTLEKFASTSGVIRHVFSEESIPVRKLIYSLVNCIRQGDNDPLVVLSVIEVLEAGLFDIFTTIYKNIVKIENGLNQLQYYGDAHVNLEMNHTVTGWFSDSQFTKSEFSDYPIPEKLGLVIVDVVNELMMHFDNMYTAFNNIILNGVKIMPEKYCITGTPPIDYITHNWKNISDHAMK